MQISAMPERAAEFRCRSAADPVPAPQNAPDFRCRPARPNRVQLIDCKQILGPDRAISGGESAIFRCRQRNYDGCQADEAGESGLPGINSRPDSKPAAWRASGSARRRRRRAVAGSAIAVSLSEVTQASLAEELAGFGELILQRAQQARLRARRAVGIAGAERL
jgi:hypothetical protein